MVYTYNECAEKYQNDYQIKKALQEGLLKKLEPGIYSDREFEFESSIIAKKYPKAVFTMNSAFYYLGLTDTIPDKYYVATDKDAAKIRDRRIVQIFDNYKTLEMGIILHEADGAEVRMYGYERMLLELLRNKKRLPFDYYKEIILNYRRRIESMDIALMQDMAEQMPKTDMILETLQMEVL